MTISTDKITTPDIIANVSRGFPPGVTRGEILALQFYSLWDISDYSSLTVDGSNRLAQINDQTGFNDIRQLTAAKIPNYVSPYGDFDGVDDAYTSSVANISEYKFLHDGTGCTMCVAISPDDAASNDWILATVINSTDTGILLRINGNEFQVSIFNGTSAVISEASTGSAISNGGKYSLIYTNDGVRSIGYINGVEVFNSDAAVSYASGNANYNLNVGQRPDNTSNYNGKLYAAGLIDRALSVSEVAILDGYQQGLMA